MIIILSAVLVVVCIMEIAQIAIFGWFIDEQELDTYFNKNLEKYRLNSFNENMFAHKEFSHPYIAKLFGIFSKWHLEEYGRIPRWSKWHTRINERHEALKSVSKSKTKLSDL